MELKAGNKPYIGMAAGLDDECSGPQLGAIDSLTNSNARMFLTIASSGITTDTSRVII